MQEAICQKQVFIENMKVKQACPWKNLKKRDFYYKINLEQINKV